MKKLFLLLFTFISISIGCYQQKSNEFKGWKQTIMLENEHIKLDFALLRNKAKLSGGKGYGTIFKKIQNKPEIKAANEELSKLFQKEYLNIFENSIDPYAYLFTILHCYLYENSKGNLKKLEHGLKDCNEFISIRKALTEKGKKSRKPISISSSVKDFAAKDHDNEFHLEGNQYVRAKFRTSVQSL